jgi:hypothetical protein
MRVLLASVLTAAVLACAVPAWAQDSASNGVPAAVTVDQGATRVPAKPPIGGRVFGLFDLNKMSASQSFTAILGTSTLKGFGAGADVFDLWKHAFVRVDVSHFSKSGSRVFADSTGTVVSLNIPTTIAMTPVDIGAGWRFVTGSGHQRITPYAGAGLLWLKYSETSSFSNSGEDVSQSYKGTVLFGGVDVDVMKHVSIGAEGQFRSAPATGASASSVFSLYNESNLGGSTIRVLFGVKF